MAKLSVTVIATVILFLLSSTLSNARIPLNLPENDVINREVRYPRQESDVNPTTIRFPNEASSYQSRVDSVNEKSNTATATVTVVPLKGVRFRPINRHFRLRSSLPFRLCHHHHHHHHHHNYRPLEQRVELPYGDDMIVSAGENSGSDAMILQGGAREVQPTWVKIHHHHHHHHHDEEDDDKNKNEISRFGFEKYEKYGKEKKIKKRFHRDEDGDEEEEREKAVKREKKKTKKREEEGGFLKHFRKFLNQFEF